MRAHGARGRGPPRERLIGAALVALAAAVAGLAVALSVAHLRRVARALPDDLAGLASTLRRVAPEKRVTELGRLAPEEGWAGSLAGALSRPAGAEARLAALNELLAETERELGERAAWPRAAVRIALFGGIAVAALAVSLHAGVPLLLTVLLVVALGGSAAAIFGRRAGRIAQKRREDVDALVAVVTGGCAPSRSPVSPGRRGRRR